MTQSRELQQFEAYVGKWVAEKKAPGIAVATAKEGMVDYAQGFGFRNRELGLPMKPDTIIGIGSVTKTFTAVAIMQLAERGLLSVHDPVVKHLPNFRLSDPEHAAKVTIHHLLTHTAGIPSLPYLVRGMYHSVINDPAARFYPFRWTDEDTPIDTYDEMMRVIAETDYALLEGPGTFFSYSNESYGLLGAIIEAVSGQPYEDFVRESLLKPAGLHDSGFVSEGMDSVERATELYCTDPESKETVPTPGWWQSFVFSAAGFMYSTVLDLVRFMDLFRTGGLIGDVQVLSPESVKAMVTPHITCGVGHYYGYGVMVTPDYHGVTIIEHGGDIKGAAALAACVPELGRTFAGLSNLSAFPTSKVIAGGINVFAGVPADQSRLPDTEYPVSAEELEQYTGQYESGEGSSITVTVADGALVLKLKGMDEELVAKAIGKDTFVVNLGGREAGIVFNAGKSGNIASMSLGYRAITKVS